MFDTQELSACVVYRIARRTGRSYGIIRCHPQVGQIQAVVFDGTPESLSKHNTDCTPIFFHADSDALNKPPVRNMPVYTSLVSWQHWSLMMISGLTCLTKASLMIAVSEVVPIVLVMPPVEQVAGMHIDCSHSAH